MERPAVVERPVGRDPGPAGAERGGRDPGPAGAAPGRRDPGPASAAPGGRLTEGELADQAEATVERIRELVSIGALRPGPDASFRPGDIVRVRTIAAFEAGGISLDVLRVGLERRLTTFDYIDRILPPVSPLSGRTHAEFAASLGPRARHLDTVYASFGLPRPDPARPTRRDDEAVVERFLEAWDVGPDDVDSEEAVARAARIVGEGVRRMTDGWAGLVTEYVTGPPTGEPRVVDELVGSVVEPSARIAGVARPLVGWLLDRHLERAIDALNVDALEAVAAQLGLLPARTPHPPAIVFVDLIGYTRLTEAAGDELAARSAANLARAADAAARAAGGEVVKLLGDGAMLHFASARAAVMAALELLDSLRSADLPDAHAGIGAGRVIARDGDYFGHTVNVAARVAGRAGPGEILVTADVVAAVGEEEPLPDLVFEPVGPVALRNVASAIALFRVRRTTDPRFRDPRTTDPLFRDRRTKDPSAHDTREAG